MSRLLSPPPWQTVGRNTVALALLVIASCQQKGGRPEPVEPSAPVRILHFYSASAEVAPGQAATICYGVENASAVRLDPPLEKLVPMFNRCFQVTLSRTTRFTLTAEGRDGSTASESFTVRVRGAQPASAPPQQAEQRRMIRLFASSAEEIRSGQTATLCYGVEGAASVRVEPYGLPLKPAEKFCFLVRPAVTTTYVLSATAPDGRQEQAQLTVRVR